ncbi:MAG: anaphase-promoting complex subunit cdc27 [Sclerophora amabilis]|nr:MAG: anaphase-promoting complex subunit cdc27 [Sclerophora amabilis]
MSPTNLHIVNQLRHLIFYHLDNNLVRNAQFLAGRLHAYEPRSAESIYLLAMCHLRLGQLKIAHGVSKSQGSRGAHLGCAYVLAQACLGLDRYREGIAALEKSRGLWGGRNTWNKHSDTARRHLPDAAAVYCLLGKLWHGYGDVKKAVDCYVEALKLNPFMWDAFLALCETGVHVRVPNIFKMTPEMVTLLSTSSPSDDAPKTSPAPEEPPPNSRHLQSQPNHNHPNNISISNDPFSGPSETSLGEDHRNIGGPGPNSDPNESTMSHLSSNIVTGSIGGLAGLEGMETPTGPSGSESGAFMLGGGNAGGIDIAAALEPPLAPPRKPRSMQTLGMDLDAPSRIRSMTAKSRARAGAEGDESSDSVAAMRGPTSMTTTMDRKRTISGNPAQNNSLHVSDPTAAPQRRSVRLFNQIRPTSSKFSTSHTSIGTGSREGRDLRKARATGTKGRAGGPTSTMGRVVSGNRKPMDGSETDFREYRPGATTNGATGGTKSAGSDSARQQEALQWLLDLFRKLGSAYFALTHFQCHQALQILDSLPPPQRETSWVYAQIGRAHYEQASYAEAERYFRRMRGFQPSSIENMEFYSTVLWHLKNEVELSYLAHELIDDDRMSPQAWCAVGNTFSLQRDHDQALKCFKRATQLDPKFAYAFTLQGHEHVANEEYDKALSAYRNGVSADHRHYNAWYGLGKVYEKTGRYDTAEKHYRTAAAINPTNAVLVLEKLKNPRAALVQYAEACNLAPRATLSRFKKARVLMALQEPHHAYAELKALKDLAPDDANVHFLLGKVYKTLRQKADAIKHFTIALNLDPKAGQYIKEAIEALEEEYHGDNDGDHDGEMSD